MASGVKEVATTAIRPRLRVVTAKGIALGPGKAELLSLVNETGSIREAATRLGMSYMRAWMLIRTMNECFREPLVVTIRGGRAHGGAVLTDTGRKALAIYQQMEADCLQSIKPRWKKLRSFLRD